MRIGAARNLYLVFLVFCSSACSTLPQKDASVDEFFRIVATALESQNADELVPLLSRTSVDYYGEVHSFAISERAIHLLETPFIQKMHIAKYRSYLLRCSVLPDSAENALRGYVASGAFDANGLKDSEYESHTRSGEGAVVAAIAFKDKQMREYPLVWEAGGWKLDLERIYFRLNIDLAKRREAWGLSDEEMIAAFQESIGLKDDVLPRE